MNLTIWLKSDDKWQPADKTTIRDVHEYRQDNDVISFSTIHGMDCSLFSDRLRYITITDEELCQKKPQQSSTSEEKQDNPVSS